MQSMGSISLPGFIRTAVCLLLTSFLYCNFSLGQAEKNSDFNSEFKILLERKLFNQNLDYETINSESIISIQAKLADEFTNFVGDKDVRSLSNAYNFLVVKKIVESYPVNSVSDIGGFFKTKNKLGDFDLSLDEIEDLIFDFSENPAIHLLLNCGAKSCPPLQFIDTETNLESLVDFALSSENIVIYEEDKNTYCISKLFLWNEEDFKDQGGIGEFLINKESINPEAKLKYLEYDWSLNDINGDDFLIYYPTKLFGKGGYELKIFNNYYTQSENNFRSNFFTSFIQLLIGSNKRFNYGFDLKLRSVNSGDVGLLSALQFQNRSFFSSNETQTFSRFGITGFGPRIKYQPFKDKGNLNFVHTVYFVPFDDAEGNESYGYVDFQNLQIYNNAFYEIELTAKKRLFFDLGLHVENLRLGVQRNFDHFTQVLIPLTTIYSYYPNQKTTFYGLASAAIKPVFNYAPNMDTRIDIDGFAQIGAGAKYYITDFLELETLYTYFIDTTPGRQAHTFNIGFRFFRQ